MKTLDELRVEAREKAAARGHSLSTFSEVDPASPSQHTIATCACGVFVRAYRETASCGFVETAFSTDHPERLVSLV